MEIDGGALRALFQRNRHGILAQFHLFHIRIFIPGDFHRAGIIIVLGQLRTRVQGGATPVCIHDGGRGIQSQLGSFIFRGDGDGLGHRGVVTRKKNAQSCLGVGFLGNIGVFVIQLVTAVVILDQLEILAVQLHVLHLAAGNDQRGVAVATVRVIEEVELPILLHGKLGQGLGDLHGQIVVIALAVSAFHRQGYGVGALAHKLSRGNGHGTVFVVGGKPVVVQRNLLDHVAVVFRQLQLRALGGRAVQAHRGGNQSGRPIPVGHVQGNGRFLLAAVQGLSGNHRPAGAYQGHKAAVHHRHLLVAAAPLHRADGLGGQGRSLEAQSVPVLGGNILLGGSRIPPILYGHLADLGQDRKFLGHPDRAAGENSRDLNRRRFFHDSGGQNALVGHSRVFLTAYQEPPGGDFLGSGHSHGGQGQLFAAGDGVHALGQDHEPLGEGDRFAALSAGHGVIARQQHLAGALHFQVVAALLAANLRDFRAGNFSRRGFQSPAQPGIFHARGQGDGALQGGAQLHDFIGNAGQVQQLQLFTAGEAVLAHAFQRSGQLHIGELSAAQEGGLA